MHEKSLSSLPESETEREALRRVFSVLDRGVAISAVDALVAALNTASEPGRGEQGPPLTTNRFAVGFDTNAIFRLGLNGTLGDNAVDYLTGVHEGPIIIPGQVVQETWKNAVSSVEPSAKKVKNALDALERELDKLGSRTGPTMDRVRSSVEEMKQLHADWIDAASQDVFIRTLGGLQAKASCYYVPRLQFNDLARIRNDTKTPPGYEDASDNHGDFYVWADFLYGLALSNLIDIEAVLLVTNDVKSDWSRGGVAHPLLVAEAQAVADGVPFYMCTVKEFQLLAKKLL